MEQQTVPNTYDYRQYDQIWQRVSPSLNPYPGGAPANQRAVPAMADLGQTVQQALQNGGESFPNTLSLSGQSPLWNGQNALQYGQTPASQSIPANGQTAAQNGLVAAQNGQMTTQNGLMTTQNGQIAAQNGQMIEMQNTAPIGMGMGMDMGLMDTGPCCMGPAAEEMLDILHSFIEGELSDRRYYMAFARQAPSWARQPLRDIAVEEAAHARRLMAVHYLITGSCYQPAIADERICVGAMCAALRTRYHEEVCGAVNYARAADGTSDPCLERLLRELSDAEYSHADVLLSMLERAMG